MKRVGLLVLLLWAYAVISANENMMDLYLNHFYIYLDSNTYSAIENDSFLKGEFAAFEKRTTVRTDQTYTGIYFYGVDTYFEFFDAGKNPAGNSGIAFGVETAGALKELEKRLQSSVPTGTQEVTRRWNDVDHPWFLMLAPASGFSERLNIWVMEYDRRFLKVWHPEAQMPSDSISRAALLQRYVAVLQNHPKDPLIRNVSAIKVAADTETRAALEKFCIAAGYEKKSNGLVGPGVQLHFSDSAAGKSGIMEVEFALQREPSVPGKRELGSSVLTFQGDKKATWQFFR